MQAGGVALDCLYPLYEQTYRAVEDALRREDSAALRSLSLAGSSLEEPEAHAAAAALFDALNEMPMRAKVHVCRLRSCPPCSPECPDTGR
jgi:hypothetical protein